MTPNPNDEQLVTTDGRRYPGRFAVPIFGVVFVAITLFVAAGLWLRHDEVLRDASRNATNLATILAEDLKLRTDSVAETLRELASFSRFIGGPDASGQEWMTLLRTVAAGRSGFEAFMVTDATGRTTFSSLPILMGESRADSKALDALSKDPSNDALIADEPQRSSNDSRIIVPLARVIRTPKSEFEGMAIANFAPEQLRDFYRTADVGENGIVWLLKPPDSVLLREPPGNTSEGGPWPIAMTDTVEPGQAGIASGPIEDGGAIYITAYRSLAGTGLTVAISLAEADVLGSWWNEVYASAVLIVLIGLAMLVATVVFVRAIRSATKSAP
jgi:hypothetical protein